MSYLHNLILQLGQEEVNNLVLLDGQRVQVDLLHAGDLAGLDETTELGDGLPLLLLLLAATTATTTAATATVTTTVAARTETTTSTGSSVSHFVCIGGDGGVVLSNWVGSSETSLQVFGTEICGWKLSEAGCPMRYPSPNAYLGEGGTTRGR